MWDIYIWYVQRLRSFFLEGTKVYLQMKKALWTYSRSLVSFQCQDLENVNIYLRALYTSACFNE